MLTSQFCYSQSEWVEELDQAWGKQQDVDTKDRKPGQVDLPRRGLREDRPPSGCVLENVASETRKPKSTSAPKELTALFSSTAWLTCRESGTYVCIFPIDFNSWLCKVSLQVSSDWLGYARAGLGLVNCP